jgi:hypothetical protein
VREIREKNALIERYTNGKERVSLTPAEKLHVMKMSMKDAMRFLQTALLD